MCAFVWSGSMATLKVVRSGVLTDFERNKNVFPEFNTNNFNFANNFNFTTLSPNKIAGFFWTTIFLERISQYLNFFHEDSYQLKETLGGATFVWVWSGIPSQA